MKACRTDTHDILIEFEGDGLALADEVRQLRGVLAETKRVKPFDWEDSASDSFAKVSGDTSTAANVWKHNGVWWWEIDSEFIWAKGECNSLLDGKMKAFEAWSKWLGQFLEEVEL